MSKKSHDHKRNQEGFTLVEMMVVLAILALVATFAVPLLSSSPAARRLDMASVELEGALRLTRSAAITRNTQMTLSIDVDQRTFASPVVPQRAFGPDIEAKLTFASVLGSTRSTGGFEFFPDGSSTGGDVILSLRETKTRICVDWLTGSVQRASVC
jgi:general secretion pathway protein H